MSAATVRSNRATPLWGHGRWPNFGVYALALIIVSAVIAPVLYLVVGGFRTNSQITVDPAGWPNPWQVENYRAVLSSGTFWVQMGNSLVVAIATTLLVVVLGLMASYALAAYRFRSSGFFYTLFTAGLMFPLTVAITPLYILLMKMHLTNNLVGVILPQVAFALPMTVIILVPFLRAIPAEIREAAEIDGCSRLGFFWRMLIPLAMPGVITTGILAFVNSWNSYMLPLFLLSDSKKFTIPLGVANFASEYSVDTARVLAFTSLAMLPALIFFSLFQRRIVGGLAGAVKG
ncbi:carbohydrate ABC transporter permease [Scrofimicrobium sp. R131]|uniref:Carbohydrate ABC transporter permease n=1 Tax=Scrofimicrobium appendicitidis TaxID=3079930 RepID=A0AAU7V6N3_9ACTO